MAEAGLDPRVNAFRPELADVRLRDKVAAEQFAHGILKQVVAASVPLRQIPSEDASLDSELLRGEIFRSFADTEDGWCWGQNQTDSYVGFLPAGALGPLQPEATHRVAVLRTFIYPKPDLRRPAIGTLSLGARLALDQGEEETRGTRYRRIADGGGWLFAADAEPIEAPPEADFVAVAERFLNTPFLWGGRTSLGLDCSALVQISLMAAGIAVPRDADMQAAAIGSPVEGGAEGALRRGDLIYWPAHVSILTAPDHVVHASGHHMRVVSEPLAGVLTRVSRVSGPPEAVRRP